MADSDTTASSPTPQIDTAETLRIGEETARYCAAVVDWILAHVDELAIVCLILSVADMGVMAFYGLALATKAQ